MTASPYLRPPLRMITVDRSFAVVSFRAGTDHVADRGARHSAGMGLPGDLHQITAVAVGILVARRRCAPQQALATLIDLATQTDRSVLDIAEHLIAHYAHPEPDGAGPSQTGPGVHAESSASTQEVSRIT